MPFSKTLPCEEHKLSEIYSEYKDCSTPYCKGEENYCLMCHWYVVSCLCGYINTAYQHKPEPLMLGVKKEKRGSK